MPSSVRVVQADIWGNVRGYLGVLRWGYRPSIHALEAPTALTDTAVKKAKPSPKPAKLSDGKGMYLLVNPNGSKLWRWKYRVLGKER